MRKAELDAAGGIELGTMLLGEFDFERAQIILELPQGTRAQNRRGDEGLRSVHASATCADVAPSRSAMRLTASAMATVRSFSIPWAASMAPRPPAGSAFGRGPARVLSGQ